MPTTTSARLGGIAIAGILGLTASTALAATDNQVLVSQRMADSRAVQVEVADLDLATAYDRETLAIRVDKAARHVCDVAEGSKLDTLPPARACVSDARSGALAQLEARGLDGRQLAMVDFADLR